MPIRSWMSSIMGQIDPEHPELFALELGKIAESDFVYTLDSIFKYQPISTKLSQNVCDHKISDEFDYGLNRTRICLELSALEFSKIAESGFVYTLSSTNVDQQVPSMVTIYMTMRS